MNSIIELMRDRAIDLDQLVDSCKLEKRVVEAIVAGRFTPSPQQRSRIAAALRADVAEIRWGHTAQVEHLYGHGPQIGRSP